MGVEIVAPADKLHIEQAATLARDFKHKFKQFCHLYFIRLNKLKPLLDTHKWGLPSDNVLKNISELSSAAQSDDDFVVSGVVSTKFIKRPDVFKSESLLVEKSLVAKPVDGKGVYLDASDEVMLEDETSWVKVNGLPKGKITSGMVIAVRGAMNAKNIFVANDYTLCRVEQPPLPMCDGATGSIGFISGALPTERADIVKLVDFLQKRQLSKLIVCGNSVGSDLEQFKAVDSVFQVLSKGCAVDVMAGDEDPSSGMLPYAPLSKLFFPKASTEEKFTLRSNPCAFHEGGVLVLGTCGENVTDFLRNSTFQSPVEALKTLLYARHIAPTAPDTLPCLPHETDDILVMDTVPHVFFAGNQDSFGVTCVDGVSLISVPSFKIQPGVTLVAADNPGQVRFVPLE